MAATIRADPPSFRRRLTRADRATILAGLDVAGGTRSEAAIHLAFQLLASRAAFDLSTAAG